MMCVSVISLKKKLFYIENMGNIILEMDVVFVWQSKGA